MCGPLLCRLRINLESSAVVSGLSSKMAGARTGFRIGPGMGSDAGAQAAIRFSGGASGLSSGHIPHRPAHAHHEDGRRSSYPPPMAQYHA